MWLPGMGPDMVLEQVLGKVPSEVLAEGVPALESGAKSYNLVAMLEFPP